MAIGDFLKVWREQRGHTAPITATPPEFPERFRGRPVADWSAAGTPAPGRQLPVLDLGASLFAPDEPGLAEGPAVRWTHDIRMASRTRDGLCDTGRGPRLATPLDAPLRQLLGRSLRLRSVVAGSCGGCEGELVALGNVVFDVARFGVQFVASPRHADGIVITGTVNRNMRAALERTWAAVPDPRIVIAVGACATGGGPFASGAEVLGIPESIPVDLWVPGCPPHPLTILDGLLRLLGRAPDQAAGTADGPGQARAGPAPRATGEG